MTARCISYFFQSKTITITATTAKQQGQKTNTDAQISLSAMKNLKFIYTPTCFQKTLT